MALRNRKAQARAEALASRIHSAIEDFRTTAYGGFILTRPCRRCGVWRDFRQVGSQSPLFECEVCGDFEYLRP